MRRVPIVLIVLFAVAACTTAPLPTSGPSAFLVTPLPSVDATGGPSVPPGSSAEPQPTATPTGAPLAEELLSPGVLTVCAALVGAPAASLDEDGQLDGYNIAIAREIAARMGLTAEFSRPLFEDLIGEVTSHSCDVSVSSQNITASRLEQVALLAYSQSRQPILVTIGNPQNVDSLEALCGLAVSATRGTTHADLVTGAGDYVGEGLNDLCRSADAEVIDLHTFGSEDLAVQALVDGDVAAYLGNPGYVAQFPDYIQYAYAALPPARQGIAVALDHPATLAAVTEGLNRMFIDGTYRRILTEYLPNAESVDIVSVEPTR